MLIPLGERNDKIPNNKISRIQKKKKMPDDSTDVLMR